MQEQACENVGTCNTDQLSFKAYFSQWLAATTALAPFTANTIFPLISATSVAAAQTCTGGASGKLCGFKYTTGANDGSLGIGQQMSALGSISAAMVVVPGVKTVAPVTNSTGGTSVGDASAGIPDSIPDPTLTPATMKDKVAAGFLTFAVMSGVVGGGFFMALD
jgi:mannan endo-1,6-alpha-mannosidase